MIQSATSNMGHTEPVPVGDGVTRPSLNADANEESTARGEAATAVTTAPTATDKATATDTTTATDTATATDTTTTGVKTPTLDRYEAGRSPEPTATASTATATDDTESVTVRQSVYGARQS